jgi:hypothetical protein
MTLWIRMELKYWISGSRLKSIRMHNLAQSTGTVHTLVLCLVVYRDFIQIVLIN